MRIHSQTIHGIDLRNRNQGSDARTPGIHLSGIIRVLAIKHGVLKDNAPEEDLSFVIENTPPGVACTSPHIMRIVAGFAWENWCATHVTQLLSTVGHTLIHQPGELMKDGVIMSPDGIELSPLEIILHEFKLTWTSSAKPVQSRIMWLWQTMGYLIGLSDKFGQRCTKVVLHPYYVNGDYRENRHPVYLPVMLEFEWAEIEKNWELMLAWKDQARPE